MNARWTHTSFGLRYLMANLGELQARATMCEFVLGDRPHQIAERILELHPAMVGLGVYIWNLEVLHQVVAILKRVHPELAVVLGGPELASEDELPAIAQLADWVICGEGEHAFRELAASVLGGRPPQQRVIHAAPPDVGELTLPYHLYDDADIAHRAIYVEASRGCVFGCEFCLSSLDHRVRRFPAEAILAALAELWRRGVRHFRFVDRCMHLGLGRQILDFFAAHRDNGLFLHFEVFPDAFPEPLIDAVAGFPPGAIQLEVGVQSMNPEVIARLGRPRDDERMRHILRRLLSDTGAHIHADLIIGLPGEGLDSFAAGFDQLLGLGVHEIQVELLKRLRGTLIRRHETAGALRFAPDPPYEVVASDDMDFFTVQRLRRFSRTLDLVVNSGNYPSSAPLLWNDRSPFAGLLHFSDWLHERSNGGHSISLHRLTRLLCEYLVSEGGIGRAQAESSLADDYRSLGRTPIEIAMPTAAADRTAELPPRQRRHHAGRDGSLRARADRSDS